MGYGKDRLWIVKFGNESETFGDFWIPLLIALPSNVGEAVFDSFSFESTVILSKIIHLEWGNSWTIECFIIVLAGLPPVQIEKWSPACSKYDRWLKRYNRCLAVKKNPCDINHTDRKFSWVDRMRDNCLIGGNADSSRL